MKTIAIIEARMNSSRLPGKILLPIIGEPVLKLLIERLQLCKKLDGIVVATTENDADRPVEELAHRLEVGVFRGSEDDVLDRVLKAAKAMKADVIVEITADCPLTDPAIVDKVVSTYHASSYDYVANRLKPTYPDGFGLRVFSTAVLEAVASLTQDPVDREHVSIYIWEHPERFSLYNVESGLPEKYWDFRLTLDTIEDFRLIARIFEELYPIDPAFGLQEVLDLLDRKPEILKINRGVQPKPAR